MSRIHSIVLTAAVLAAEIMLSGCQSKTEVAIDDSIPVAYVDADGSHQSDTRDTTRNRYPHLLLPDGKITLNDRCPVTKASLNNRLQVIFVNGSPIGFC
jgi:hypothetical protein